jgi:hypothetical protein
VAARPPPSEVGDLPDGTGVPGRGTPAGRGIPGTQGIPAAYDARKVGRISSMTRVGSILLGCGTLAAGAIAVMFVAVGVFWLATRDVASLGPTEDGLEFYPQVGAEEVAKIRPDLLEGLETPFYDFVMGPNIAATEGYVTGLDVPKNWDIQLLRYTTASVEQHIKSKSFFGRLDAVQLEYARVVTMMRAAGLPEVLAAIPYQESRYQRDLQSLACARGYWQFMPEVAYRVAVDARMDFTVKNCRFRGRGDFLWSPSKKTPPPNVYENGEYMENRQCIIERCEIDDRSDIEKSTAAAAFTLGEAWKDPAIARSGAAVQIIIASHNAGYDDGRFGAKKSTNLLPAYQRWAKAAGQVNGHKFVGENIKCPDRETPGYCGSALPAETQHYVYPIIAQHLLAVCYYAQNYPQNAAFQPWVGYATDADGYCKKFKIPNKSEAGGWKKQGGGR